VVCSSSRPSAEPAPARADSPREPHLANQEPSSRQTLVFDDNRTAVDLYGPDDCNLRLIESELGVDVHSRGNEVRLIGSESAVALARKVLEELYVCIQSGQRLQASDVRGAIRMVSDSPDIKLLDVYGDLLSGVGARRSLYAKNLSQRRYLDLMRKHDVSIAIGPAGTGKTYLAMAMAVAALNREEVSRLVLTRPAVEAGEKLGFLPGDLVDKVDPYMRPLYDALHDMMDFNKATRLIERSVIEVAPLAFMRGRTLNDAFVILDEAQNTTREQMKMFLTRLGYNSKAVITGDITQIDLDPSVTSGLVEARDVLADVDGIGIMYFTKADVVRHPLVQSIISAYELAEERRKGGGGEIDVVLADSKDQAQSE
jgi:phosphate starvation-inducible PhoH-like protein